MMISTAITLFYAAKVQLLVDTHAYIVDDSLKSDDFLSSIGHIDTKGQVDSY